MTQLLQRQAQVSVDSLLVTGLRVVFKAKKTSTPEPNTLDLKIFNLAAVTRAQMQKKGSRVVVQAGYLGESLGLVFSGDARTTDHVRDGADWVTHVQCGDGERSFQFSRVSLSFAPGAKATDVILGVAKTMGMNLGNLTTQLAKGNFRGAFDSFVNGYVAHGRSVDELDRLLRTAGLEWSIQDGALQLLRPEEATPGTAERLASDTGLIGSPEHGTPEKPGKPAYVKASCLLRPNIRPGSQVLLDAESTKGLFRAVNVEHEGDTSSGPWETRMEALPL